MGELLLEQPWILIALGTMLVALCIFDPGFKRPRPWLPDSWQDPTLQSHELGRAYWAGTLVTGAILMLMGAAIAIWA